MIAMLTTCLQSLFTKHQSTLFGLVWRRHGARSELLRHGVVVGFVQRERSCRGHCWIAYHEPDTIETVAHSSRHDAEQLLLHWIIENVVIAPDRYVELRRAL